MLKLEKVAKTRELNAILREKPSLLSHSFLVALSYALFCHLMALLLFQISPFKISYEPSIISPVMVATDSPFPDAMQEISVHYTENSYVPDYLIAPKHIPKDLPALLVGSTVAGLDILTPQMNSPHPFATLENSYRTNDEPNLFPQSLAIPQLTVRSSGKIAEREITIQNAALVDVIEQFASENATLLSEEPYKFEFAVQVDVRRGEICWWEQSNEVFSDEISGLAASIIKSLKFTTDKETVMESGNIELTLSLKSLTPMTIL